MPKINITIEDDNASEVDLGKLIERMQGKYDPYEGSYEITPSTETQLLETKDLVLLDNLKILGSEYFIPENIRAGVELWGEVGTLDPHDNLIEITISPDLNNNPQEILPENVDGFSKINVEPLRSADLRVLYSGNRLIVNNSKSGYLPSGNITEYELPTKEGGTITPGADDIRAITQGEVAESNIIVKGDKNLLAANIKKDEVIFGVKGEYEGINPTSPWLEETYNSNGQLTSVVLHGYTVLRKAMFYSSSQLQLSELPEGILIIKEQAFAACSKITISHIPASVKEMSYNVFDRCSKITKLYFDGTPEFLDERALYNMSGMTDLYVPWSEGEVANAPWGLENTVNIHYDYNPNDTE